MKLIMAYIQPERLNAVKQEMYSRGVYKMSVTNALGCGQQRGYVKMYRGAVAERIQFKSYLIYSILVSALVQLAGVASVGAWAFGCGLAIFYVLKRCGILRCSEKEELKGLDLTEHGEDAYASFQFFSNT